MCSRLEEEIETYHILVCEFADLAGLDTEVLERLSLLIDYLINVLHLDLLCRQHWPPEKLVENPGSRLEDLPRNVDVSPLGENLLVDHLGDLGSGVLLGSVQLIDLRGSGVVVKHQLKSVTNVD